MKLEAVWFKNGKEIYKACPVTCIVCDENMKSISDIEIESEYNWHSCDNADDFVIRLIKDE